MNHCHFVFYCQLPYLLHKEIMLHQCSISRRVDVSFLVPTRPPKEDLNRILWQTNMLAECRYVFGGFVELIWYLGKMCSSLISSNYLADLSTLV